MQALLWSEEQPATSPVLAAKPGSPIRLSRRVDENTSLHLEQLRGRVAIVDGVRTRLSVAGAGTSSLRSHASDSKYSVDDGSAPAEGWLGTLTAPRAGRASVAGGAAGRTALIDPPALDVYGEKDISRFIAAYKFEVYIERVGACGTWEPRVTACSGSPECVRVVHCVG